MGHDSTKQTLEYVMEKCEESRAQAEDLRQMLLIKDAHVEQLAQRLRSEQIYAESLAQQLRTVAGSRLWRTAQWLRRLAGRESFVLNLDRPAPPGSASGGPAMAEVFREIYVNNAWGSEVSRSGAGSDLRQTAVIREVLPVLLRELGARSLLDVPCGDFHWMRMVDLELDYIGADVVADLIAANTARYATARRRFQVIDIAKDTLPRVDLILCRDLLVHFSFGDALRTLANLKRSGSTFLLTTTFTNRSAHVDIATGQWRAINLQLPPFNFPSPLRMINENCTEYGTDWADKSLGLWRLVDL